MPYSRESDMYAPVRRWLEGYMHSRFPRSRVHTADVHRVPLYRWILQEGLEPAVVSDLWRTFDIRVDIAAVVVGASAKGLVLVECKMRPISLRDLSQLLGYARVALPLSAFLFSLRGVAPAVSALLQTYGRWDVLEYHHRRGHQPRRLVLARWDTHMNAPDPASILPPGAL